MTSESNRLHETRRETDQGDDRFEFAQLLRIEDYRQSLERQHREGYWAGRNRATRRSARIAA